MLSRYVTNNDPLRETIEESRWPPRSLSTLLDEAKRSDKLNLRTEDIRAELAE
jgi:hypothetical protein